MISVSPGALYSGATARITVTVPPAVFAVAPPMLQVNYGDGTSSAPFPYGSVTLTHAYNVHATTTEAISLNENGSSVATTSARVVVPAASLSLSNPTIESGGTVSVTIATDAIAGQTGPPMTLDWGDGSPPATNLAFSNQTLTHTYSAGASPSAFARHLAATAQYTLTLSDAAGTLSTAALSVVSQQQNLVVPLAPVAVGAPAQIAVVIRPPAGFIATPLRLDFGDGTSQIVTMSGTYPHVYTVSRIYTVQLFNTMTQALVSAQAITVAGVAPRVPIGQIYSSTFTVSPVLAGSQTHVLITWTAAVPTLATIADPIEGYIDLLDAQGNLVRRSDVFEISPFDYQGPGLHTSSIPYDTPVDAAGTYQTRVVLFSAQGGTISVGPPATLIIIGGPDPEFKASASFHDTGALEIGPHAGEPGVTFDPGLTVGILSPTYSGTITGLFDPVSHRTDPLATVKSADNRAQFPAPDGTPQPTTVASPAAVPSPGSTGSSIPLTPVPAQQAFAIPNAPATLATPQGSAAGPVAATPPPPAPGSSVPHTYTDLLGRGQTTLPDILGGGTTLRGLDVADTVGTTTYQVGYGYTQLGTEGTSPERGAVADINRTLGTDGNVRVTYFGQQDDPTSYPAADGTTGPLATGSEVFALNTPTFAGFKLTLTGALSEATSLNRNILTSGGTEIVPIATPTPVAGSTTTTGLTATPAPAINGSELDAADKIGFTYTHKSDNFAFDYHNYGPDFAVGAGPGATSDRVGFDSAANLMLSPAITTALLYTKDDTRSAFSRQSNAGATFNFALPHTSTFTLGITRNTALAPMSDTRTDGGAFSFGTHVGVGTLAVNGTLSSLIDFVTAINDAVTRTASVQYALSSNGHSLGVGINTTETQTAGMAPIPAASMTPGPGIGNPTSGSAPGAVGSNTTTPLTGNGGNAQVGESLTYGFPFGGRLVNGAIVHGFVLQLSGTNSNSRSSSTGGYDEALSGILSYHLTSHLALGLRSDFDWHNDNVPSNRHKASDLRLRLDLTQ
jgi:hypothetical protein